MKEFRGRMHIEEEGYCAFHDGDDRVVVLQDDWGHRLDPHGRDEVAICLECLQLAIDMLSEQDGNHQGGPK